MDQEEKEKGTNHLYISRGQCISNFKKLSLEMDYRLLVINLTPILVSAERVRAELRSRGGKEKQKRKESGYKRSVERRVLLEECIHRRGRVYREYEVKCVTKPL